MTPLNERLDEIGWYDKRNGWQDLATLQLKWMQQATAEIERLQHEVELLKK